MDRDPAAAPLLSTRAIEALQNIDPATLSQVQAFRDDFARFIMPYKLGIDVISTKVGILRHEVVELHDHTPTDHISSRLKSPESIEQKGGRNNCEPNFDAIRASITD